MNKLSAQSSPYLLQHKDNPVNWYAWGEEAFSLAREEQRPIFLSIGYSTCYWCHVMEGDSFEDMEVADFLNRFFISIKVDREERPDVDKLYMDAVVALGGQGGWPMSIFLDTDLRPFYGGTFFPKGNFLQILAAVERAWRKERGEVLSSAQRITDMLSSIESHSLESKAEEFDDRIFEKALRHFESYYDAQFGGFGEAPKFPPHQGLMALLVIFRRTQSASAKQMLEKTLYSLAAGGIFDHLEGGFSRYSTDRMWLVPHFEKMLYDNAQLARVYFEAYRVFSDPVYREVGEEVLSYVSGQMLSAEGGFYSAEDAGEVGKEGEYYVFSRAELEEVFSDKELEEFSSVFFIPEGGNFDGDKIVLSLSDSSFWQNSRTAVFRDYRRRLLAIRSNRNRVHLDDKVLTAWNAMMISAYFTGYRATGNKEYLKCGINSLDFILNKMWDEKEGILYRRYRAGERGICGVLSDYAYLVSSLLDASELSSGGPYLEIAEKLQLIIDRDFWNKETLLYNFSTADLIVLKRETLDGALPSTNSVCLLNLLRLETMFQRASYGVRAGEVLSSLSIFISKAPNACACALLALDMYLSERVHVKLPAPSLEGFSLAAHELLEARAYPNIVFSSWDKSFSQICSTRGCAEEIEDIETLEKRLQASLFPK